ncbi:unnamed protein product [Polarella glacialis]|uniref:1-alkyl-2-acetylglycerophosphocholine esterase n=1 Tax=Polarella glacialis TaxID=89957 RepID=A0A813KLT2_POLGL|nr:unnamed protein product [Polarella glacialis]
MGSAVEHTSERPVDVAPPEDGLYPIIFFHHGFPSFRMTMPTLHSHWASHGFVVVAADHPGRTDREHVATEVERDPLVDTDELYRMFGDKDGPFARFSKFVDLSKVVLSGESGGALCVVTPKLELSVVKAAKLYIAMVMDPVQAAKQYPDGILDAACPPPEWGSVLALGGLRDTDRPRQLELAGVFWEKSTVRVVLLEDAPHLAWDDAGRLFDSWLVRKTFAWSLGKRRSEIDAPCLNYQFCHVFAKQLSIAAIFEVFPTKKCSSEMAAQALTPDSIQAFARKLTIKAPRDAAERLASMHQGVSCGEQVGQDVVVTANRGVNLYVKQAGSQELRAPISDTADACVFQQSWADLAERRTPAGNKAMWDKHREIGEANQL